MQALLAWESSCSSRFHTGGLAVETDSGSADWIGLVGGLVRFFWPGPGERLASGGFACLFVWALGGGLVVLLLGPGRGLVRFLAGPGGVGWRVSRVFCLGPGRGLVRF